MKLIAVLLLFMNVSVSASEPTQDELSACYFTAYAHITKNWLEIEMPEEEFVWRANFVMSRTGLKKDKDTFVQVSASELLGKGRKFKQGLTPKHPFFNEQYGFGERYSTINKFLKDELDREFELLPECSGVFKPQI